MILERYIHREILAKLGWIIFILLLILASDRFVDYLADAAAGNIPGDLILQLLGMKMLSMLPKLLPVALFLGVMLALSRMVQDREFTVVSSAGVAERFKVMSILRFSVVFALIVFVVSFYVSPWAEVKVRELRNRAEVESDIAGIAAGQFREFSKGDTVVYAEELSNQQNSMKDVFLQVRRDADVGLLNSDSARFIIKPETGSRYVLFENGNRYDGEPGSLDYRITTYRTYAILLEQGEHASVDRRLESLPVSELWGSSQSMHKAELQWRLSFVIAALLLPLFAVALNRFAVIESRYAPVFICILVYLIYSNLLGLSKTMLKRGEIPEFVGLWWVHLLLLGIIVFLANYPGIRRVFQSGLRDRAD